MITRLERREITRLERRELRRRARAVVLPVTMRTIDTIEGHVCEQEAVDATGAVVGYWAYGIWDPSEPYPLWMPVPLRKRARCFFRRALQWLARNGEGNRD